MQFLKYLMSAIALMSIGAPAGADTYPSKPVEVVVPFTAGATTDLLARIVSEELQKEFGKPFVVVIKPGAGGQLGSQYVASAKPDGYTLLITTVALTSGPFFQKSFTLDPINDFSHIAPLADAPAHLVVSEQSGISNVKQFLEKARSAPRALKIGFWAPSVEMNVRLLEAAAGAKLSAIPYQGFAPTLAGLLSDEVSVLITPVGASQQESIKAGKIKTLGVADTNRTKQNPDVPTLAEKGLPLQVPLTWFGIAGPKGMPDEIVQSLNAAVNKALNEPRVTEVITNTLLYEPVTMNVEQYRKFIVDDYNMFKEQTKALGIEPK